jgi:adenine-specific DNA-methyltransferase
MPTLDWIGKSAVVNHHREVPTRLLHCDGTLSAGDADAGNLLVEGDNLEALKALLPYYAGQVKCIYIDPPYNTGNEGWVYNDNVNSAEIRAWLGKVVGREAEDLSRHDKWLCMMYPRLRLLRDFLREDGIIFISIDRYEFHNLKQICDDIFGNAQHVATLVWKRRGNPDSRNVNGVSEDHEYVLSYGRTASAKFKGAERDTTKYTNPDGDARGAWMSDNLTGLAGPSERPNLHYSVVNPATGIEYPPHPTRGWAVAPSTMDRLIAEGRILWPKAATGRPRIKRFQADIQSEHTGFSSMLNAPTNEVGTKEINQIFGEKVFAFPKPTEFVKTLIRQATDEGDLVLDSFAGSGTTGVASDRIEGGRRFVLVELDPQIARNVTAERLRRSDLKSGFRYCTLGKPLFDEWGTISEGVSYADLAAFVFFSDTGSPIPAKAAGKTSLLGTFQNRTVHLLWSAESAGVANAVAGNVLTAEALAALPKPSPDFDGAAVVYGEGCTVTAERLAAAGVTFKQIPYQVIGA